MKTEATLRHQVMDFGSIRRNVIANLTQDISMSTSEAFDMWDRIDIDIHARIDFEAYYPHWDPEYNDYWDYMKSR